MINVTTLLTDVYGDAGDSTVIGSIDSVGSSTIFAADAATFFEGGTTSLEKVSTFGEAATGGSINHNLLSSTVFSTSDGWVAFSPLYYIPDQLALDTVMGKSGGVESSFVPKVYQTAYSTLSNSVIPYVTGTLRPFQVVDDPVAQTTGGLEAAATPFTTGSAFSYTQGTSRETNFFISGILLKETLTEPTFSSPLAVGKAVQQGFVQYWG